MQGYQNSFLSDFTDEPRPQFSKTGLSLKDMHEDFIKNKDKH